VSLRGGLIGCGFFAENHLNAWAGLEGAEIAALCDLNPDRLAEIGHRFGIGAAYSDAADMLTNEQLDFVDIATTVSSHLPLVTLAAGHVATIICQKPFAGKVHEAEAMVAACADAGATLLVHENFRWQRAFVEMKRLVDQGLVGTPHFGRFAFRHGYDNYVNQPYLAEIERFAIMDVGLHLFDLTRLFFGEATHLSCSTQRLNPAVRGEDAFTALVEHRSGARSICDCSFYSVYDPEPFPNTAALIEGDQGTLELDRAFALTVHTRSGRETLDLEPEVPRWGGKPWHGVQDSVVRFQRHAVDVMRGHGDPQPSGADNIETLRLAIAAYEAAEGRRTIDMRNWQEARS